MEEHPARYIVTYTPGQSHQRRPKSVGLAALKALPVGARAIEFLWAGPPIDQYVTIPPAGVTVGDNGEIVTDWGDIL